MIFFHGTSEENIKNIKKNGILAATSDPWILEVTGGNVCCLSKEPASGEGGNAAYFAGRTKNQKQNGYLVAIRIHREKIMTEKLLCIFDNKELDDYVRYHFFVRQEFKEVGYNLYADIKKYVTKDHDLAKIEQYVESEDVSSFENKFSFHVTEQRNYYKNISPKQNKIYTVLETKISDELYSFIQLLGWQKFYLFLELHFKNTPKEEWQKLVNKNIGRDQIFWEKFYQKFPLKITPRDSYFQNWFSSEWLAERSLDDISDNCQILTKSIESEYILGIIQITTPSGVIAKFKSCKTKQGFSRIVWKEVNKILEKK